MKKVKEDVEELKSQIIEKSIEIFANKDYKAINMKDISDAIGISRGPLYYHFKNKEELYLQVVTAHFKQSLDHTKSLFTQDIHIKKKIEEHIIYSIIHNMSLELKIFVFCKYFLQKVAS